MRVALLASTTMHWAEMTEIEGVGASAFVDRVMNQDMSTSCDVLSEFAGRACYQSWSLPNEKTATNEGYIANILEQRHYSVLEHASFTVYAEGVSRALLTELTRHRHLSFSVMSQRFVDESESEMVIPPALADKLTEEMQLGQSMFDTVPRYGEALDDAHHAALAAYGQIYASLTAAGLSRKQAREAARAVLPNATETKMVVTGNLRAWREVIEKRSSPHADAEIQEFARLVLYHAKGVAPAVFADM